MSFSWTNASSNCPPRLPTPMKPRRTRSLAPRIRCADTALRAMAPAVAVNVRREIRCCGMRGSAWWGHWVHFLREDIIRLLANETEMGFDLRVAEFEQTAALVGAAMAVIPLHIPAAIAIDAEQLNADRSGDESDGQAPAPTKLESIIRKPEEQTNNRHGFAKEARTVAPTAAPV